jgi:hypothetical protein
MIEAIFAVKPSEFHEKLRPVLSKKRKSASQIWEIAAPLRTILNRPSAVPEKTIMRAGGYSRG